MTTPPPHKEAMELAREIWFFGDNCTVKEAWLKGVAALLEQRDAQVRAEAIERAASVATNPLIIEIGSFNRDYGGKMIGENIADTIRTLSLSPHWLERERVKARIESLADAAMECDKRDNLPAEIQRRILARRAELEKLLAVTEGEKSERSVASIPDCDLVKRALRNCRPKKPGQSPRWSAVSDSFCLGSTFSIELCRRFNIDPHEQLEGPVCETCQSAESNT
jgi:hypothetical protein